MVRTTWQCDFNCFAAGVHCLIALLLSSQISVRFCRMFNVVFFSIKQRPDRRKAMGHLRRRGTAQANIKAAQYYFGKDRTVVRAYNLRVFTKRDDREASAGCLITIAASETTAFSNHSTGPRIVYAWPYVFRETTPARFREEVPQGPADEGKRCGIMKKKNYPLMSSSFSERIACLSNSTNRRWNTLLSEKCFKALFFLKRENYHLMNKLSSRNKAAGRQSYRASEFAFVWSSI